MKIHKFISRTYEIKNKKYIKITRNQLLILDALLNDGGYTKKYNDRYNNLRYSEHFGMLDFNNVGLEKIIISGITDRIDENDEEILLPADVPDAMDYEYFFHTHPPTPTPGGRINQGILYEFPSISDLYHFADHFNEGTTQGSIVVTPEGIYIIIARSNIKHIKYPNSDSIEEEMIAELRKIQYKAISSFDKKFDSEYFYKKIARNTKKYLNEYNKMIDKYWGKQIKILFKGRSKDKKTKKWLIDSFYLPVKVIEPLN